MYTVCFLAVRCQTIDVRLDFAESRIVMFCSADIVEMAEESKCCYERYRILVQNECAGGNYSKVTYFPMVNICLL